MKRALFLLLPLALGAVLWGVNWKLDHPPMSKGDKELRLLWNQAQTVDVLQLPVPIKTAWRGVQLQPQEVQQLAELLRVEGEIINPSDSAATLLVTIELKRNGRHFDEIGLALTKTTTSVWLMRGHTYLLHPRFERRLRAFLDQVAPQRFQP